jgi:hypothetical protein
MKRRWAALAILAAAAIWAPAKADPPGVPGGYAEPEMVENPLLACYRNQMRVDRLGPRRNPDKVASLQKILECGLKWVALEPNSPQTAALAKGRIDEVLTQMWRDRRFVGAKPDHAFFTQCGDAVTPKAERDQGLLVCMIGVAVLRPAEFEILKIARRTANSP